MTNPARTIGRTARFRGSLVVLAAAALLAIALAAGWIGSRRPTLDPDRPPGHAARTVAMVGEGSDGVRAQLRSWRPARDNALPPARTIEFRVRLTGRLSGRTVALTACAVTRERIVVACGDAHLLDPPSDDRPVEADTVALATGAQTDRVVDVLLLPDQYHVGRVSRAIDPKDGTRYTAPRVPVPGDHLH